ncbi:putative outer membrane lipoprotein [Acanthamoeba polyphaga mimivirus]|uniref:Putative outer membrane lipoprotein n=1 Tax=Acanthamoeba polyphaga mimivirus TaxID=212035 RepID=A0A0G2Y990_MIMIV|nr:putative outer membrane lipoprotein [Acanthamoeba castellanii mamavirus]AKI79666.1 putative outer membrane lipoprotein [Acanthamoeba polyphaga mimivirus]EJN40494.1 putative outer membrane lipoprotein [Acanthamoeba polyphaga lentillevirus]UMZ07567.1 putative outer membrane lipoprotein [Acanthamoeba polyphaga mimivirus]
MWIIILIVIIIIVIIAIISSKRDVVSQSNLDIQRYMGTWYEISRLPTSFQKGCVNSTANYQLLEPNKIQVTNNCEINGRINSVTGVAIPAPNTRIVSGFLTPASLMVNFGYGFSPYNVIFIDENYQYAIVSGGYDTLWILSRFKNVDQSTYNQLVTIAYNQGYDVNNLIRN